jgi:hypothetical protein
MKCGGSEAKEDEGPLMNADENKRLADRNPRSSAFISGP